jgi:2,3-bisphosphoglycerate-independent phosphoglycerate mutase
MKTERRPLVLVIIEGWGYSPEREGNAILQANTPYYDEICAEFPQTLLSASGEDVGLPEGVAGNSGIGHLTIGAGRVVPMNVTRIDQAIENGDFFRNEVLKTAMQETKSNDKALHLIGLLSDVKIHSSQEHLFALLRMAKKQGLKKVFIHCFLDGHEWTKVTADIYLEALEIKAADIGCGQIASLCGRYYAMDKDNHWERTARAYTMLAHGEGERAFDAVTAVRHSYQRGVADEFVQPIVIENEEGVPVSTIQDGDTVICFNFSPKYSRQIAKALAFNEFNDFAISDKPRVSFVGLTEYDHEFELKTAFPPLHHKNFLAEVWAKHEIRNLRLAESERENAVTRAFNGDVEKPFDYEEHLILPSTNGGNYENEPEMSAFKVTDKVLRGIESEEYDVFVVNLVNPDAVGKSGNFERTIEAVQYVDTCLGWIVQAARKQNGVAIVTSSHGKCEQMLDPETSEAVISPTPFPVPFHLIDEQFTGDSLRENGSLADIAPTILGIMGIEQPPEMTGRDLREI